MVFNEYFRKLMGWCPLKDSLQKGRQEEFFSEFKSENGNRLVPSSTGLRESKILKGHAVLSRDLGIVKITLTLLIILIVMTYVSVNSNLDSILHIFYSFIQYLALLALILYNRTTVMLTPEKIIIRRYLFKSLILQKEDIAQISVSKNKGHSYRWPLRLLVLATLAIRLPQIVESIIRTLQESAPVSEKFSLVLVQFWSIAFVLVIFYIFELLTPYQQILKITTCSNLNLEFYVDEPEEIMSILKKENE
jgi:Protein of unknown function (DUF1673)